jgi:uncharacterized Ntn-hydrolase superfamily protein
MGTPGNVRHHYAHYIDGADDQALCRPCGGRPVRLTGPWIGATDRRQLRVLLMTWSIIARDATTGRIGVIVASKFFAVGALVAHVKTGTGAVASQAFANPHYGPRGLALLAAGVPAEDVITTLIADDDGRDHRQLHVMDRQGRFGAHTGPSCIAWRGHEIATTCSVAGNMLAGPAVLTETIRAYEAAATMPFARRLIAAMQAGEGAGGDKRGKQSAAMRIHDGEDYPLYDLRVDDHADPLGELARLQAVACQRWVHFRRLMPSRLAPSGLTDRDKLEELILSSVLEGYE